MMDGGNDTTLNSDGNANATADEPINTENIAESDSLSSDTTPAANTTTEIMDTESSSSAEKSEHSAAGGNGQSAESAADRSSDTLPPAAVGESSLEASEDQLSSPASPADTQEQSSPSLPPEPVDIKIIYNKRKFDHTADLNNTILDLKSDIEKLTGVPIATQKVMFKGSTHDEQTLKQLKVTKTSNKFMVIGSTMNDLLKVAAAPDAKSVASSRDTKLGASAKEPLCKQTAHKKVLDKHGKPEDIAHGIKGSSLPLPPTPLSGMYNKYGGKTRLTFKLDNDELWIGTKERTQKVKMGSIKDIVSQPIEENEDYHIMGLQLGTTEASKYWIYWVPAQYVNAIKDTILGKWGDF